MTQYLLTPPNCLEEASAFGLPLGHMAFSLGEDGHIHYGSLPSRCRGGLMVLGTDQPPEDKADPRRTVQEILSLCQSRQFGGVVLDLECPPTPFFARLIRGLEEGLYKTRRGLFLPETYSAYSNRALLYLSSALSGGSLEHRLKQAADRYGPHRLVLSLHRAREDFFLPSPDGKGRPISQEELDRRIKRLQPRVFFSKDLCAHYFTYMSRETGAHFVLFDDGESLRKKRETARNVGIPCCFWVYPETAQLLAEVIP